MYKISKRYQYPYAHSVCVFMQPDAWVTVPQQIVVFFNNFSISPYNFLPY